jgi:hypothetical protein
VDSLELRDLHTVALAEGRKRYRAAVAQALAAFAQLHETARAIRHSADALGDPAILETAKFIAAQDTHLFTAAYDWRLAATEDAKRALPPENSTDNPQPK